MRRRLLRLNVLFQHELAELIQSELRDPRLGPFVSITRVDTSPDLEKATVYVSVMGDDEAKQSTMQGLKAAGPFLRRQLLARVHIRRIPVLQFALDETIEEAAHVLDLMKKAPGKDAGA